MRCRCNRPVAASASLTRKPARSADSHYPPAWTHAWPCPRRGSAIARALSGSASASDGLSAFGTRCGREDPSESGRLRLWHLAALACLVRAGGDNAGLLGPNAACQPASDSAAAILHPFKSLANICTARMHPCVRQNKPCVRWNVRHVSVGTFVRVRPT
jgi:hypothetical protein